MNELSRLAAFGLVVFALVSSPASDEPAKEKAKSPACDCVQCDCENCDCGEPKQPEPTEPDPDPVRHNEIDVHTMENCKGCVDWKSTHWVPTKRVGWGLKECELLPEHTQAPSFTVWLQGKAYTHSGFMNPSDLQAIMDRHYGRKTLAGSNRNVTPASLAGERSASSVPSNYEARWTYPGSIESHLQGPPHYMDTSGMTRAEMLKAHDDHHEAMRSGQSRTYRSSSCPGGNCPTRTYSRRRGLFGVFR